MDIRRFKNLYTKYVEIVKNLNVVSNNLKVNLTHLKQNTLKKDAFLTNSYLNDNRNALM